MTLTIKLAPETEACLRDKAAREGQDAEAVVAALLAEALEWEAQDRAEAAEGIRRGLEDFKAGRSRSLEDMIAGESTRRVQRGAAEESRSPGALRAQDHVRMARQRHGTVETGSDTGARS